MESINLAATAAGKRYTNDYDFFMGIGYWRPCPYVPR